MFLWLVLAFMLGGFFGMLLMAILVAGEDRRRKH